MYKRQVYNILQMIGNSFFYALNITFFQALHNNCMLCQSIIDTPFQRIIDGLERVTFIPQTFQYLQCVAAAGGLTERVVKLSIDVYKRQVIEELKRQGLTEGREDFLEAHTWKIMDRIQDPTLRRCHVMEG